MKVFRNKIGFIAALLTCLVMSSSVFAQETITKAIAVIQPTENNTAHGIVTFVSVNGGVRIVADIDGLKMGEHGFHIHEFGDLSAIDGSSAGGHFNPTKKMHGCLDNPEHHVGDIGNIIADKYGHAHYDAINNDIKFEGGNNIIGRTVIIHAEKDDCQTQPSGNAGPRIGWGVIGIGK